MPEEIKALSRRFLEEVFNEGNLTTIEELIDPDWGQHDPSMPDELRRIESARQLVEVYGGAFLDLHIIIEEQVAEWDMVTTRWTALGTHQGELMGIPPSGNQVTTQGMSMERFSGRKFVAT
jgi:predicted ester cyclase